MHTCLHCQLPMCGYLPILHRWILRSNLYVHKHLPNRPVNYGEPCCSPHFVVSLSLSPKSTEVKKKTHNFFPETKHEADCCTFTTGRRQNMTFRSKNTGYKNTQSRTFQPKISLGWHQDFLNTSTCVCFIDDSTALKLKKMSPTKLRVDTSKTLSYSKFVMSVTSEFEKH